MKLKITKSEIGKHGFGNTISLQFAVSIIDDNGKTVRLEGYDCTLFIDIEDDYKNEKEWLETQFNNFEILDLVEQSSSYIKSLIWSKIPHKHNLNSFIKVFAENQAELFEKYKISEVKRLTDLIATISSLDVDSLDLKEEFKTYLLK